MRRRRPPARRAAPTSPAPCPIPHGPPAADGEGPGGEPGPVDHYGDGTYTWWHRSAPCEELCAALSEGWLGPPGMVLEVGCGLGSDLRHLSSIGWQAVGIDLSATAVRMATDIGPGPHFARADLRLLPFRPGSFDAVLDRGCFHYVGAADRHRYADAVATALVPGGRFLLRASLFSAGVRNEVDEAMIEETFAGFRFDSLCRTGLRSDTRLLEVLVARLRRPG